MDYLLYADGYAMPSKVAINPEEPCLGRIRADSVAPPHTPTSIKRCISRVERNSALVHADLFSDTSSATPLKEGQISILHPDGPGLSPNNPMAIVQVELEIPLPVASIPDGKYLIKSRAAHIYWCADWPITKVHFWPTTMEAAKNSSHTQVNEHSPIIQVFRG